MANFTSRREFHEFILSGNEEALLSFYANTRDTLPS